MSPSPPHTHTHTERRTDCLLPLSTEEHFDQSPILNEVCNASALNYAACYESTVLRLSLSITVLLIIALGIIVVSKNRDERSRASYLNKRVVEAQRALVLRQKEQRERLLTRQKKTQEDLIHSIFPKVSLLLLAVVLASDIALLLAGDCGGPHREAGSH